MANPHESQDISAGGKSTVHCKPTLPRNVSCLLILFLVYPIPGHAEDSATRNHHQHHHGADHGMTLDADGMLMNANTDRLPRDCPAIAAEHVIEVRAGTEYASAYPDTIFGMDQHEWHVPPCSRITVTFINEDQVRHQWMLHGLPKYLYDQGMFHLEAAGGTSRTGTFIVPSDDRTYLVHCDLPQHMEKGMKAQLVVGRGSGNLSSIPGISGPGFRR